MVKHKASYSPYTLNPAHCRYIASEIYIQDPKHSMTRTSTCLRYEDLTDKNRQARKQQFNDNNNNRQTKDTRQMYCRNR